MKAKLTIEKDYSFYEQKHKIKEFYKIIKELKISWKINELLEWFEPNYSKAIQTPENSEHNLLTFSDKYIENLQKFATK